MQAEQQLDQCVLCSDPASKLTIYRNWTLMKQGLPDVPTWQDFLSKVRVLVTSPTQLTFCQNLENSLRIGIDPSLISAGMHLYIPARYS